MRRPSLWCLVLVLEGFEVVGCKLGQVFKGSFLKLGVRQGSNVMGIGVDVVYIQGIGVLG